MKMDSFTIVIMNVWYAQKQVSKLQHGKVVWIMQHVLISKRTGSEDKGVEVYTVRNDENETIGYVINQESVDLNAYLYAEKGFLKEMAEVLGYEEDAEKYTKEAKKLRKYINKEMYDEETGFYYDVQTNEDGSEKKLLVNRGKGTEAMDSIMG